MPLVTFTAGQKITAAELNLMQNNIFAYKTADESVTSSTTLQSDNELSIPSTELVANAVYALQGYLFFQGDTTTSNTSPGGLAIQWSVPASSTIRYQPIGTGPAGGMGFGTTSVASSSVVFGTLGAGVNCGASINGSFVVANNLGPLTLMWAQNVSDSVPTIMKAQSWISLTRIS